ncbi:MAG: HEPN domain-containing protein [Planctomycetaceae bacterium]|jgi:HEPN domain-containing protein|nr:HEPN domain-containing protein [Planctomycetaceae bacterium]
MREKTAEWFNFADRDIVAAEELLDHPFLTNVVAFHCQQAVEKYLKAVLAEHDQKIPKIHNLLRLYALAKKYYDLDFDEDVLTLLTNVYSEDRYPFEVGYLPSGVPSKEESHQFCELAKAVEKRIKEVIV